MKRTPTSEIGALQWHANEKTAELYCFASQPGTLSVDILDPKGRMIAQHKTGIQRGPNQLSIPLPNILPGEYNAWVQLDETTAIRPLTVEKSKSASGRLQEWVMRLF